MTISTGSSTRTDDDAVRTTSGRPRTGGASGASSRDRWFSALVLAVAATAWFGWGMMSGVGQIPLTIGWGLAIVMIVVVVMYRGRAQGPVAMHTDPAVRATYWRWIVIEVVLIVGGNLALTAAGHVELQPAWTLAVVGAHFLPLARAFHLSELVPLGLACVAVAVLAAIADLAGLAPAPALAGGLGGALMLGVAGYGLVQIHRAHGA